LVQSDAVGILLYLRALTESEKIAVILAVKKLYLLWISMVAIYILILDTGTVPNVYMSLRGLDFNVLFHFWYGIFLSNFPSIFFMLCPELRF
jgi:hypothetical protein